MLLILEHTLAYLKKGMGEIDPMTAQTYEYYKDIQQDNKQKDVYKRQAMRRADIDIAYSEGFSPHQIMSFAAPLGVGITSDGEYLDIEVHTTRSSEESLRALNEVMVEVVQVLEYKQLPEGTKNAMSSVAAADYTAVSYTHLGCI